MDSFEYEFKVETLDEIHDNLNEVEGLLSYVSDENSFQSNLNEIFRLVHSAKGNSKSAGFDEFSKLIHLLEDQLTSYKNNKLTYSRNFLEGIKFCINKFLLFIDQLKASFDASLDNEDIDGYINLMLKADSEEELADKVQDITNQSVVNKKSQLRFLVVDDDQEMVEIIEMALEEKFDCEIIKAFDGRQAFQICRENYFDIIITDHNMPNMNGQAFIESLRASYSPSKSSPIIFISGERPDYNPYSELWENIFILEKPFMPKKVLFHISCALKEKKSA